MSNEIQHAFPTDSFVHHGMTLRDYFAAKAMQTLITDYGPADAATEAYEYADAMLKERAK